MLVGKHIYLTADAVVAREAYGVVLVTICLGDIMVLAVTHRHVGHELTLGQVIHEVGKVTGNATEALKREHLVVVQDLFHSIILQFFVSTKSLLSHAVPCYA